MGIQLYTTVYGPDIMRELANDGEEFRYGLMELAENFSPSDLANEIKGEMSLGDRGELRDWLRVFANCLDPENDQ